MGGRACHDHEESGCPAGCEVGQQLQPDNVLCPAGTVRCYSSGLCTLCAGCPKVRGARKKLAPLLLDDWAAFFHIYKSCFELLIFVCLDAPAPPPFI